MGFARPRSAGTGWSGAGVSSAHLAQRTAAACLSDSRIVCPRRWRMPLRLSLSRDLSLSVEMLVEAHGDDTQQQPPARCRCDARKAFENHEPVVDQRQESGERISEVLVEVD